MAFWSNWFKPKTQQAPLLVQASGSSLDRSWSSQSAASYAQASKQFDELTQAVELPIYGIPPPVLVSAIAGALTQLEQGMFYQSAYLWDGMLRDDRVTATINVRLSALFGSTLDLEPGADTNKARKVKEACEKQIGRMLPTHQLMHLQRYALGLSVGIAQVLTDRESKSTKPTIKVWNPRYLRYDWTIRKYCLVTQNRGEIVLDPDDPEWIIWEPFGPQGWLHGALIRSLAQPWLIRHWVRSWWARYQEVHGMPIRAGIIPAERKPKDEALFLSQLANIAHESVVRLPQGQDGNRFDLKLVEATSTNWQGFRELLNHCDESIAIVLLGQKQSTSGQGGLGTQEKAGESTIIRLLRGDAAISDCLREQFLKKWAVDNYGDEDLAPYLEWQIEPPEDLEKKAKTLLTLAQAFSAFAAAPAYARHIDIRALAEENELPLVPEDQVPPDVPDVPGSLASDENKDPHEAEQQQAGAADAESGNGNAAGSKAGDEA